MNMPVDIMLLSIFLAILAMWISIVKPFATYLAVLFIFTTGIFQLLPILQGVNIAIFLEICLIAAILTKAGARNFELKILDFQSVAVLLFALICLASAYYYDNLSGTRSFKTIFVAYVIYISSLTFVDDFKKCKSVLRVLVASAAFCSVFSLLNYSQMVQEFDDSYRTGTDVLNANALALMVDALLPIVVYLISYEKNKYYRVMLFIVIGLFLTALVVTTKSRMGFIGLISGLLMIFVSYERWMIRWAILTVCVIFFLHMPQSYSERIATLKQGPTEALGMRHKIYSLGLNAIREHPLMGIGFGNYTKLTYADFGRELEAHNSYISIAAETGLPALILYLSIILVTLKDLWKLKRRHAGYREVHGFIIAIIQSICVLMICGLSMNALFMSWIYVILALPIVIKRIRVLQFFGEQ